MSNTKRKLGRSKVRRNRIPDRPASPVSVEDVHRISPGADAGTAGLDAETVALLREAFPAPNPDIVRARRLRMATGMNHRGYFTVTVGIPRDVMAVTGMRLGDTVLVSGWQSGVIRIVRVPEGADVEEEE